MAGSPRSPAVAGAFYERAGDALAHQIEGCFTDPRGPGELPTRHRGPNRRIRAVIVPHAGYQYSGAIAARAYYEIAAERPPETVLILGVDHQGAGEAGSLSARDWTIPIGPVQCDGDLVRALDHPPVQIDEEAHRPEHSVEVQLPFLDYVLPKPKFAALLVRYGRFETLEAIAEVVRRALVGRDVLIVASTDFSHYISPEEGRRKDQFAIDPILRRDPHGLYEAVREHDISMCGVAPTTVLLAALREETLAPRLLAWGHSGEAEPMARVVDYASFLLESDASLPVAERR